MNFLQKRQKFANEQRRKQRQVIFKKNRALLIMKKEEGSTGPYPNLGNNEDKYGHFNSSHPQIEQLAKLPIDKDSIDLLIRQNNLQSIMEGMPKWIAHLGSRQNTLKNNNNENNLSRQDERGIIQKIITICAGCLERNRLLVSITNCLVEITSLSEEHLAGLGILEQFLVESFLGRCYQIFMHSTDMRVVFNCVYICGNLHKKFVAMTAKFANAHRELGPQNFKRVWQLQEGMLNKMEEICSKYPNYENCLEILLWFLKNCLLMYTKPQQSIKSPFIEHRKNKIEYKCITVTQRIVVSLCSKLGENIPMQSFRYFCSIIKSAFGLLSFVMSDPCIYHRLDISMDNEGDEKQEFLKSKGVMSEKLLRMFETIGESVTIFMSVLERHYEQSAKSEMLMKSIAEISETMTQILINISSFENYEQFIPGFIPHFCTLVAQGVISCSQGAQTCSRLLEILANTQIRTDFIALHLLTRCKFIFEHKKMVFDRNYRVGMLSLFQQLQDTLSQKQVKSMLVNLVVSDRYVADKDHSNGMNQQKSSPSVKNSQIAYLNFMLQNVIPPVLRVIQILLIDQDPQNQVMGLKIISKFTRNWEIEQELLKNELIKQNLHIKIIEMQEEKNQLVYNAALDLIEQLALDQFQ